MSLRTQLFPNETNSSGNRGVQEVIQRFSTKWMFGRMSNTSHAPERSEYRAARTGSRVSITTTRDAGGEDLHLVLLPIRDKLFARAICQRMNSMGQRPSGAMASNSW